MVFLLFAVVVAFVFPWPWNVISGVALAALAIGEGLFWYGRFRGMQRRLQREAEAVDDATPGAG
jgi:Flp pilus assembly protein TadB